MDIYVLDSDGQQQGPFTPEQIKLRIQQNTMPPTSLAWHSGIDDWVPVSEVIPHVRSKRWIWITLILLGGGILLSALYIQRSTAIREKRQLEARLQAIAQENAALQRVKDEEAQRIEHLKQEQEFDPALAYKTPPSSFTESEGRRLYGIIYAKNGAAFVTAATSAENLDLFERTAAEWSNARNEYKKKQEHFLKKEKELVRLNQGFKQTAAAAKQLQRQTSSTALLTGSREEQLRAAASANFAQQMKGRRLSTQQFMNLDVASQNAISSYHPEILPSEMQTVEQQIIADESATHASLQRLAEKIHADRSKAEDSLKQASELLIKKLALFKDQKFLVDIPVNTRVQIKDIYGQYRRVVPLEGPQKDRELFIFPSNLLTK